jgi:hypothetical protein
MTSLVNGPKSCPWTWSNNGSKYKVAMIWYCSMVRKFCANVVRAKMSCVHCNYFCMIALIISTVLVYTGIYWSNLGKYYSCNADWGEMEGLIMRDELSMSRPLFSTRYVVLGVIHLHVVFHCMYTIVSLTAKNWKIMSWSTVRNIDYVHFK